jgi:hypothetical protein
MVSFASKRRIGRWIVGLAALTAAPTFLRADLKLRVLDQTGGTWLINTGAEPIAIDAYSLASAHGLLVPEDWISITQSADSDPQGVVEVLGQGAISFEETFASPSILAELNLNESAIWPSGGEWRIGRVFGSRPSATELEAPGELTFEYHVVGEQQPTVSVVEVLHCGDLDRDRDVDASDLTTLITGWTGIFDAGSGTGAFFHGDCDGDLDVDASDLSGLILNWTGAAPVAAALRVDSYAAPAVRLVPEGQGGLRWVASGLLLAYAVRLRLRRTARTNLALAN